MAGICQGRVVIVTGAGRGIGRAHALEFARQGAQVIVNDTGAELDGTGKSTEPADKVAAEIQEFGGQAIATYEDVSDWDSAERMINTALDTFGDLHVVVNNAGILRDRMLINMTPEEWDSVLTVHMRGAFAVSQRAAVYWRKKAKNTGPVDARIINTSSASGLYGNVGQTNYGAAKAGIAAFTIIAAEELQRYGITVNAIAPLARTRMTEKLTNSLSSAAAPDENGFVARDPNNVSPLVVWLGSQESRAITGKVFNVHGGHICVAEGWMAGPTIEKQGRWDPAEIGSVVPELVAKARPNSDMAGNPISPS